MPTAGKTLTWAAAHQLCESLFEPGAEQLVGLEVEWPVHRHGDVAARPTPADMARASGCTLPAGGRLTFEPGGQAELSSATWGCVGELFAAMRADELALAEVLRGLDLELSTLAVDDRRVPGRVLVHPRYEAMERYFTAQAGPGTWMMCNTASTQINISHDQVDPVRRWRTMSLVAPVLIAAFANSPGTAPDGTRWASLRQAIWWGIDPARTRPVCVDLPPAQAWLQYALDADVMFVNREGGWGSAGTALTPGLRFGSWMSDGHELGWPTLEDLRYHLSTLFPPVRPRGWLELRVLDALPGWMRDVATLVVAAGCTPDACRELQQRLPDTRGWWRTAAEVGLADAAVAAAADVVFEVAADHLAAVTTVPDHHVMVETYHRDYVAARRAPGADRPSYDLARCLAASS